MKLKTVITEMLNIELPIVGAPMFLVSYPELVSAVSEAGGIGTFPTLNYRSIEELRDALHEIREKTNKPIGANIILYKEHNPNWSKQLETCLDFKVELIITSMGTPRSVVNEAKSTGTKIFCGVTNLRQGRILAKGGAHALIAVSQGAGGHAGSVSPYALIPQLKEETNLPILASGAISGGRQMAASFALGADGVYVGTRFIASDEARADDKYKQMLIESDPTDILYTDEVTGVSANWLKASLEKIEGEKMSNQDQGFKRWKDIWSAGHGVARIKDIAPIRELINRMLQEYKESLTSMPLFE